MNIVQVEESDALLIHNKDNQVIFKIDNEGVIFYLKDGELKTFEDEKELSIIFVQIISGLTGGDFKDRDEIIQKVIKNYRDGKINNLLG
jgi:anthranilate phosphoribosyltransferase